MDSRGILRGVCNNCDCSGYKWSGGTHSLKCEACQHPPAVHAKLLSPAKLSSPQDSKDDISESPKAPRSSGLLPIAVSTSDGWMKKPTTKLVASSRHQPTASQEDFEPPSVPHTFSIDQHNDLEPPPTGRASHLSDYASKRKSSAKVVSTTDGWMKKPTAKLVASSRHQPTASQEDFEPPSVPHTFSIDQHNDLEPPPIGRASHLSNYASKRKSSAKAVSTTDGWMKKPTAKLVASSRHQPTASQEDFEPPSVPHTFSIDQHNDLEPPPIGRASHLSNYASKRKSSAKAVSTSDGWMKKLVASSRHQPTASQEDFEPPSVPHTFSIDQHNDLEPPPTGRASHLSDYASKRKSSAKAVPTTDGWMKKPTAKLVASSHHQPTASQEDFEPPSVPHTFSIDQHNDLEPPPIGRVSHLSYYASKRKSSAKFSRKAYQARPLQLTDIDGTGFERSSNTMIETSDLPRAQRIRKQGWLYSRDNGNDDGESKLNQHDAQQLPELGMYMPAFLIYFYTNTIA